MYHALSHPVGEPSVSEINALEGPGDGAAVGVDVVAVVDPGHRRQQGLRDGLAGIHKTDDTLFDPAYQEGHREGSRQRNLPKLGVPKPPEKLC